MVQRNQEWPPAFRYTDDPQKTVAEYLVKYKGNILKASHYLGIDRRWLYTLIVRYRLWPLVNKVRRDEAARSRRKYSKGIYV